MSFLQNLYKVLRSPSILCHFLRYIAKNIWYNEGAVLNLWGGVRITGFNGFSEYYTARDAVDECELAFFRSLELGDGDLIDVGANIGVVTALLGHQWPDRRIHAFEPGPSTFKSLERTIQINYFSNIIANNLAVSDEPGKIVFDTRPHSRATARLIRPDSSTSAVSSGTTTTVPATSLDHYVRERGIDSISLLKVDVEGYEPLVFKGSGGLLSNQAIEIIYFEVCPPLLRRAGFSPRTPGEFLVDHGYDLFTFSPAGLVPVKPRDAESVELANWVATLPRR